MTKAGLRAWSALTLREQQIATVLCTEAPTDAALSERLGLSRHTTHQHLKNIYCKLGIGSRIELVIFAYNQGWVQPAGGATVDSPHV